MKKLKRNQDEPEEKAGRSYNKKEKRLLAALKRRDYVELENIDEEW